MIIYVDLNKFNKIAGILDAPPSIVDYIKSIVIDKYNKVTQEERQRITDKSFPPEKITLDFSNTKYQFLNHLMEKTRTITLCYFLNKNQTSYAIPSENSIHINLNEKLQNILIDTIEHEILHIIQVLIQKYSKSQELNSGLIPPKFRNEQYDVDGYKKEKTLRKRYKRIDHSKREIEKYPNMLSLIRNLQFAYQGMTKVQNISKKEFFEYFLHYPEEIQKTIPSDAFRNYYYARSLYKGFDLSDEEFKNWLQSKIYNEFVNQDPKFNYDDIVNEQNKINEIKNNLKENKVKENKVKENKTLFFGKENFSNKDGKITKRDVPIYEEDFNKLGNYSSPTIDFAYDFLPGSYENDDYVSSTRELGEEFIRQLPYIRESEDKYGSYKTSISFKFKSLSSIFNKLKTLDIPEKYVNDFANSLIEEIQKSFRYMFFLDVDENDLKKVFNWDR